MLAGQPSRTALAAATHRAVHQMLEGGAIFADPLALRVIGRDPAEVRREAEAEPQRRGMRCFLAARSRFAEASLADAVAARGVRQLVVLGAGLDTFACRSPYGEGLPVFEIDHPATQAWKRQRLADAGIEPPAWLRWAPVDFEREALTEALANAGFDGRLRSFFIWLGVVPYLTPEAIFATLGGIAALPGGAEVAFDYSDPPGTLEAAQREAREMRAARVAAIGEPWLTTFEPSQLHAHLRRLGFATIDDLGPRDIARRYFSTPADRFPPRGGHVLRAAT